MAAALVRLVHFSRKSECVAYSTCDLGCSSLVGQEPWSHGQCRATAASAGVRGLAHKRATAVPGHAGLAEALPLRKPSKGLGAVRRFPMPPPSACPARRPRRGSARRASPCTAPHPASCTSSPDASPDCGKAAATPMLTDTSPAGPPRCGMSSARTAPRMRSAIARAPVASRPGSSTVNSSPPNRAPRSRGRRRHPRMQPATACSTASPAGWP